MFNITPNPMLIANKLKKGDTIVIITPSQPIAERHKEPVDSAIKYLNTLGLNVIFSKHAFSRDKYGVSGGSIEERASDINEAFSDPNINAIWCVHGGDTANEILDYIDYENIKNNPKLFLGKSDIDLLHLAINKKTGLIPFHAPDIKIGRNKDIDIEYSKKWFSKRLLEGKSGSIEKSTERKTLREGTAKGKIIGCNITTILKLVGTEYFPNFKDSIFFLEAYTPDIRKTVFQLTQLKQIGVFDQIKGLVIGYMYGYQDAEILKKAPKIDRNGNKVNYEDIVLDITKEYKFPILKINEFGHYGPNAILPIGVMAEMDAKKQEIVILEECVK